ncbi:proline-rich protein PRCC [Anopheles aquasalis]|uniref:proline-rich protein PRCC n=1 Tax=Anopheles aquasalis TaxID=42839 RepID=UPI00215B1154|nr:proline-rich protein PRCC [Anopheles aquasalis]
MSLVSYDYSSGEESEEEKETEAESSPIPSSSIKTTSPPPEASADSDLPAAAVNPLLPLPAPKQATNELDEVEEDDEFLHKKAIPADVPLPTPPPPPPKELAAVKAKLRNGKVQITIPSMKDFENDDGGSAAKKSKVTIGAALPKAATSLLSLLPKPRTVLFAPSSSKPATAAPSSTADAAGPSFLKRLVPDSVANRPRSIPASVAKQSTNGPAGDKPPASGSQKPVKAESSEDEDDGDNDFFSFNKVDALPSVSANEITAMVAKKAAKIAETVRKYTEPEPSHEEDTTARQSTMDQQLPAAATDAQDLANENALAALIGGNRAKRGRVEEVDLIEITSADIVPSKEDFLRRQLQDETGYVPTGHLVGDWKCTSKKKSHITQLASKAQANAQELEAMWAANRQSRRQTQSKYGF